MPEQEEYACANGSDKHGCRVRHKSLGAAIKCRKRRSHNRYPTKQWDKWRVHYLSCTDLIFGTSYGCNCTSKHASTLGRVGIGVYP